MLLAVALAALMLACSTVRLAYNNLPELGYLWLDGYFDFNAAQADRAKQALGELAAWHRRSELPRVAALLARAETLAAQDITPAQACEFGDAARERLLAVARQAEPASAALALDFGPAQFKQLEKKFGRLNAEFRKDWLSLDTRALQDKRYEQFLDRYEDFYGRLEPAQRELLQAQVAQSVFDAQRVDANRRQRQQESLAMLRRLQSPQASPAEAEALLHAWVQRIAEPAPGAWRDYQSALIEEGCRNLAALHNITTPEQRRRAARRLRDYADDVRALLAATPAAGA